jgi:hypothetical protein
MRIDLEPRQGKSLALDIGAPIAALPPFSPGTFTPRDFRRFD